MQQWWQKKISLFAGVGGAVLLILQSVIAGMVWPLYNVLTDPISMLTATDAPFRVAFLTLQVVAWALILFSLIAITQQYRMQRKETLENQLKRVAMALAVYVGLMLFRSETMATIAIQHGFTASHMVNAVIILVLVYTLFKYMHALVDDEQTSLVKGLYVLVELFVAFHVFIFIVGFLGWQVRGFLDVLAFDILAATFGFICWYYGRKTAV